MKLSDAIIEGSKGKDQAFGYFGLYDNDRTTVLKVCALGAAIVGSKAIPLRDRFEAVRDMLTVVNITEADWDKLVEMFPILDKEIDVRGYPELDQISFSSLNMSYLITDLNDSLCWPIDQIVEFVRKIEAHYETE